jgi:hypothetical protein
LSHHSAGLAKNACHNSTTELPALLFPTLLTFLPETTEKCSKLFGKKKNPDEAHTTFIYLQYKSTCETFERTFVNS